MRKLGNCYAVILPLDDENISSGQLVILQAIMLGKPAIVTRNRTVTDYIIDGYNGYVIEKNEESLIKMIKKLKIEISMKVSLIIPENILRKISVFILWG